MCRRRALSSPLIAHRAAAVAAVKGGSAGELCEGTLDRSAAAQAMRRARSNFNRLLRKPRENLVPMQLLISSLVRCLNE